MENQRTLLLIVLAVLLLWIWQAWEQQHQPLGVPAAPGASAPAAPKAAAPPAPGATATTLPPSKTTPRGQRIHVVTDLLRATIDTDGGDLRDLALLKYPVSVDKPGVPFPLLADRDDQLYITQSGLVGRTAPAYPNHNTVYRAAKTEYVLAPGQNELRVPLTWTGPDGVRYTKTFVFQRDQYLIDVDYTVDNTGRMPWAGYMYAQFQRTYVPPKHSFFGGEHTYVGGAYYTHKDKFDKVSFEDMEKHPLDLEAHSGWVAMLQHYFVSSWMPPANGQYRFYTEVLPGARYVIGYQNLRPLTVAPSQTGRVSTELYAGPTEHKRLRALAPGMNLTVDFGWLTVIASPLFHVLSWIHRLVGNWGWSIIILTILIKAAFFPLSATSYRSMAKMRQLQPKLQHLKERHGDDKQRFQQAMMELYKTEKVNPLGGCLPMVVQIPVFIALYWMLLGTVEMRQAPFALWIHDLSSPDPYFILPILMGVTMFAQQLLSPASPDPMQRKVMLAMPVVFTVFFLFFPAGLVLYWLVNNVLSIAQQWYINRTLGNKPPRKG